MKSRRFRNVAFSVFLISLLFAGGASTRAAQGDWDFWKGIWNCHAHGYGSGYFGTDGWQYILCDTNCDPNEDIQWYNYFYNQTYYACNDYCNLQSWLPYYYCYEWNTEIFPDGIDECETFCECRCEVG